MTRSSRRTLARELRAVYDADDAPDEPGVVPPPAEPLPGSDGAGSAPPAPDAAVVADCVALCVVCETETCGVDVEAVVEVADVTVETTVVTGGGAGSVGVVIAGGEGGGGSDGVVIGGSGGGASSVGVAAPAATAHVSAATETPAASQGSPTRFARIRVSTTA